MGQINKVIVIGGKGMAGHVIYHYLKENTNFQVLDIARNGHQHIPSYQIDVTDFKGLTEILEFEKPNVIINCVGVLNNDAEENPDKSILLNSYFPHFLAKAAKSIKSKLIHISTDCVFNGEVGSYTEYSDKDGRGFYAETKALGEISYGNNLTLRTSIIGPELYKNGIGLFHWFMQQKGLIKGYTNAIWTGVTTLELAKVIVSAIEQNATGLHHVVNGHRINKFDLVSLFKKVFNREDIKIEAFDNYTVDKSLVKTNQTFAYTIPSYEAMVQDMKTWIDTHQNFYDHYRT